MAPQPFIPLADGAQVEVVYLLFGEVVENRLWFVDRQPPVTEAHLQNLAEGVASWSIGNVMPFLAAELNLAFVRATSWTGGPALTAGLTFPNVDGGNTSGVMSANVAYRVRFFGFGLPPSINNANFVPGIPRDQVDHNLVSPVFKEAMRDAYVTLIDAAAVFGPFPAWEWVCTSRRIDNAWRSAQVGQRTDQIRVPSPWVSPRRRRLPRP
jgi:hypothetical protein